MRHLQLKKIQSIEVKQRISNFLAAMFIWYSKRLVTIKTYLGRLIFTRKKKKAIKARITCLISQ